MPHSMTAFANLTQTTEFGDIVCEIRSVNSRFLDQNLYLSDIAKFLEKDISELIKDKLGRGKVDLKLLISANPNLASLELNEPLADNLIEIINTLQSKLALIENQQTSQAPIQNRIDLTRLLQHPDLLIYKQNLGEEFKQTCLAIISATLDELIQARKIEGDKLAEFILEKTYLAKDYLQQIEELSGDSSKNLQEKLKAKLSKLETGIDENKLAQEVAFLAQKSDIAEEIDRIKTHLIAVDNSLRDNKPIGRKLDFLMQEIQREINTLSAKAYKVEMSNLAIEIKVLNEQIREQVQNLE